MAGFKNLISTTADSISSGGTITGDLTISGDLTVSGGGSYAYSEVLTGDMKITNTAASTAFEVEQSTGDGVAVLIDQNSAAVALSIDSQASSQHNLLFDAPATTVAAVIRIDSANSLTTGQFIKATSDSSSTSTRNLVEITNDNTAATGATGLKIQQYFE